MWDLHAEIPGAAHLATPAPGAFPGEAEGSLQGPHNGCQVQEQWSPVLEQGLLGMREPLLASNPIDFQ